MDFANKNLSKISNEWLDKKLYNRPSSHNAKYYLYSNKSKQKPKNWFVNYITFNENINSDSEYNAIEKSLKIKWMNQFKSKISLDWAKTTSNSSSVVKNGKKALMLSSFKSISKPFRILSWRQIEVNQEKSSDKSPESISSDSGSPLRKWGYLRNREFFNDKIKTNKTASK